MPSISAKEEVGGRGPGQTLEAQLGVLSPDAVGTCGYLLFPRYKGTQHGSLRKLSPSCALVPRVLGL